MMKRRRRHFRRDLGSRDRLFVGQAVESVAPDSGLGEIARQGEGLGDASADSGGMPCRNTRPGGSAAQPSDRTDGRQIMRLVQRRQRDQLSSRSMTVASRGTGGRHIYAAMNDPCPTAENGFTIQLSCGA